MVAIVLLVFFLHLCLSFKRPQWGFCSLLAIKILIPDNVRVPFGDMSLNTACSFSLFALWLLKGRLWKGKLRADNRMIWFLIVFVAWFGFTMLITNSSVPVAAQFKTYMAYVVLQFLPVIVMIDVIRSREDLLLLLKCFLCASAICVVYSVGCFVTGIPYPYNEMVNSVFPGRDSDIEAVMAAEMGGIAGRCMGTATSGTWDYGMVVTALFLCVGSVALLIKKKVWIVVWVLLGIDVLCTTRRSPLIASMLFLLIIFLLSDRKKIGKKLAWIVCGGGVLTLIVYIFPQLSSFRHILESSIFFWDDSVSAKNDVNGSSVAYRTYQMKRTMELVADSPIFGNGWGSTFYGGRYRDMNGWESTVFTVLMQFGYFGFLLWAIMFYRFYRYSLGSRHGLVSLAFIASNMAFCVLNDTIYPFYIFFGAVLINKMGLLELSGSSKITFNNAKNRLKNPSFFAIKL